MNELVPGEIGAVAKVEEIEFDCVLHDSHDEDHIHLKALEFPLPMAGLAVETKKKGDEQRPSTSSARWRWRIRASRSSVTRPPTRR